MTAAKIITAMTIIFFVSFVGIGLEKSPGTAGIWFMCSLGFFLSGFLGLITSVILMINKNKHAYVILAINLILLAASALLLQ
jgi:hypothetical protein